MKFIPIIGMEIHVEPATTSKMFCECDANHFGAEPNTHTCPVCLGHPGALPIPNKKAIDACVKLGLALGCSINLQSKFDRKHYYYPDLPKAYQISQYDIPFAEKGSFEFAMVQGAKLKNYTVGITRVHMEEDTGKLSHNPVGGDDRSLIDFNRSGVPLIEIVTEPDLHSPAQAKAFLKWLSRTIKALGISECDMEKGSMRLEANISVAQVEDSLVGEDELLVNITQLPTYKVEVKNVNSFRFIEKAIEFEIARHIVILKQNKIPDQETRGYSESKGETFLQRKKENAKDYRYFPDPDIPPVNLIAEAVDELKLQVKETPKVAFETLLEKGVRADYAELIVETKEQVEAFEQLITLLPQGMDANKAASVIVNQKLELTCETMSSVLEAIKASVKTYAMDEAQLKPIVQKVLSESPEQVAAYKAGKVQILGYFIGQVAKETKGQADPKLVSEMVRKGLE